MGRKNRNVRRYTGGQIYSSFQAADKALKPVDLSNVTWCKKTKISHPSKRISDVFLNIVKNTSNRSKRKYALSVSIVKDKKKAFGDYTQYALVNTGFEERMYFQPTDEAQGYKCRLNTSGASLYITFPLYEEDVASFKKYIGNHELFYDQFNDVYYITPSK